MTTTTGVGTQSTARTGNTRQTAPLSADERKQVESRSFVVERGAYLPQDLRDIACILRKKGYNIDENACGSDVFNTIEQFQRNNNLTPDRKVGDATWSALLFDNCDVKEGKSIVAKGLSLTPQVQTDDFVMGMREYCGTDEDLAAGTKNSSETDDPAPVVVPGDEDSKDGGPSWLPLAGPAAALGYHYLGRRGGPAVTAGVPQERAVVPYRAAGVPAKAEAGRAGQAVVGQNPRSNVPALRAPTSPEAGSSPTSARSNPAALSTPKVKVGDVVQLPLNQQGQVIGFENGKVRVEYWNGSRMMTATTEPQNVRLLNRNTAVSANQAVARSQSSTDQPKNQFKGGPAPHQSAAGGTTRAARTQSPSQSSSQQRFKVGEYVSLRNGKAIGKVTQVHSDGSLQLMVGQESGGESVRWSASNCSRATPEQIRMYQNGVQPAEAVKQNGASKTPEGQKAPNQPEAKSTSTTSSSDPKTSGTSTSYKAGDRVTFRDTKTVGTVVENTNGALSVKGTHNGREFTTNWNSSSCKPAPPAPTAPRVTAQTAASVGIGAFGAGLATYNVYITWNDPKATTSERAFAGLAAAGTYLTVAASKRLPGLAVAAGWLGLGAGAAQVVESKRR